MKSNNNLLHVIYNDKEYWFTKKTNLSKLTGLTSQQVDRVLVDEKYASKHGLNVDTVDGSEIKYKSIDVM